MEINNNINHLLALKAAKNSNNLEKGILIHKNINLYDNNLLNALIDFYGKFGKINEAETLFNSLENKYKNIGISDCLMTDYINNGMNKQELDLYDKCKQFHDNISHVLALKACINANDFDKGLQIQSELQNHKNHIFITTALIDFYGKFGHIFISS